MASERDKEIVYRPLYESPILSVHDCCCHIERGGPGGGIKVTVAGKEITVCCDECVEKAQADPAKYAA